jgi:hypothetical protein
LHVTQTRARRRRRRREEERQASRVIYPPGVERLIDRKWREIYARLRPYLEHVDEPDPQSDDWRQALAQVMEGEREGFE